MAQIEKIMSIYYGTDKLPYKDEDRQVHYPIAGETNTFVGENNTTKVRFYVDRIGGSNYTWVAKVKKPNGTICSQVLEMDNDDYVDVDLSFLYTDQVGQIDLALSGYTAKDITITENDGVYEISGNPIVICTGIIKIIVNYAPLILNMGASVQPSEYQQILALLSTKISYGVESEKVNELPTTGKANTIYYVKSNASDIVYDVYYWNGTSFAYLGTTAYELYTKDDGRTFELALQSYINTKLGEIESEIQQVASGSPKGVYDTLSDLETAYPTGTSGIYLVLANGHWYYWNSTNNAWTDGGTYLASAYDNRFSAVSQNAVQNKTIVDYIGKKDGKYETTYSYDNYLSLSGVSGWSFPFPRSAFGLRLKSVKCKVYVQSTVDVICEIRKNAPTSGATLVKSVTIANVTNGSELTFDFDLSYAETDAMDGETYYVSIYNTSGVKMICYKSTDLINEEYYTYFSSKTFYYYVASWNIWTGSSSNYDKQRISQMIAKKKLKI